jgi:hypothetical protein
LPWEEDDQITALSLFRVLAFLCDSGQPAPLADEEGDLFLFILCPAAHAPTVTAKLLK